MLDKFVRLHGLRCTVCSENMVTTADWLELHVQVLPQNAQRHSFQYGHQDTYLGVCCG